MSFLQESRDAGQDKVSELNRLNQELLREIAERQNAEEQLEQRTRLLATLLEVSNLVSSTLEIRPLMEAILDKLKTIIDYAGARLFILDGEYLRVQAYRGSQLQDMEPEYAFSVNQSPIGHQLITDRKPVVISDIYGDTPSAQEFRRVLKKYLDTIYSYANSWIALPLVVKDRVVGLLTMDHAQAGFYQPHHIGLGMAFANQAAIEFENARLYSETVKRADELQTMFAVQQAITSRLDRNAVLQKVSDEAKRLTDSERTAVFLLDRPHLVLSVFSGKDSTRFLGYRMPVAESLIGKSLIDGVPVIVNDTSARPDIYSDLVNKAGVRSFLSVPLIAGTRPIGTITVVDKANGCFTTEDERILTMLASVAVIGLENSRMYQEEHRRHLEDERRRRVAESLRDILAVLNSNRPLADILHFIIDQATRLLGTGTGALYRLRGEEGILHIEAALGLPEIYVEGMNVPVGMGAVGRAVIDRKPVAISNLTEQFTREFFDNPERKAHLTWLSANYKGILAVPLMCKDEIYGGIVLYYPDTKQFTKEEIELAMIFADQAALAIDNARLRAQAEEMAVAAERSRLARDLHDAVTQTLFSASLIAEVLPKLWERNPEEGRRRLEELRQLARGALAEMRTLLLELRPATLMEAPLEELLRQLTEASSGRARIPVKLSIEGLGATLATDVKITVYRVAQEALNNVVKHSGAENASITLRCEAEESGGAKACELRVRDDGRGFNPAMITSEHLGIGIMKERTEIIGATLEVISAPGQGTEIVLTWEG